MAVTRLQLLTDLKVLIRRDFDDIDSLLQQCIDIANEIMGRNISAIYDETEWEHTIIAADYDNNIDNWKLPASTKKLNYATLVDTTDADQYNHYELVLISPYDAYKPIVYGSIQTFDYTVDTYRIPSGGQSRVDREAQPRLAWQYNNNLFVYPRPSSTEDAWLIRVGLQIVPDKLTADGSSNTLTDNFEEPLKLLTGALFWSLYGNDEARSKQWLQWTSQALTGVATDQELAKLGNIILSIRR